MAKAEVRHQKGCSRLEGWGLCDCGAEAEAYRVDPPSSELAARMIKAVRVEQVVNVLSDEGLAAKDASRIARRLADLGLLAVPKMEIRGSITGRLPRQ